MLAGRWYQLAGGAFQRTQAPGQPAVAEAPWTVQARVSDLGVLQGRLYLAVNGYGLAALEGPASSPRFAYHYEPRLFGYRTITALVPQADSLLCHLYFNSLLNLTAAGGLPEQGLALLAFSPQEAGFRRLPTAFQASHPGWECVGFAPLSAGEFLLEWKFSGPERTLFEYTRYRAADAAETMATRQEFREAWEPLVLEAELPEGLQPLLAGLQRRESPGPGAEPALFLTVRWAGQPLCRRYARRAASGPQEAETLLTAHAFLDAQRGWLLAADGLLLSAAAGQPAAAARRLPDLPAGFRYAGLYVREGLLLACWEQADFTTTGAAGVFLSGDL